MYTRQSSSTVEAPGAATAPKRHRVSKLKMHGVKNPQKGQIQIFQEMGGTDWRWRLRSVNGRILADSGEGYKTKQEVLDAANRVLDFELSEVTVVELEPQAARPLPQQPPAAQTPPSPTETPGKVGTLSVEKGVNLVTVVKEEGKNTLTWTAPSTGGQVAMYHIERKAGKGKFVEIVGHSDHLTATTYVDTKITAGVDYTYRVRAHGVNGKHGPYSNMAHPGVSVTPAPVTPAPAPQPTPGSDKSAPFVQVTSPGGGATVGGEIKVMAEAYDLPGDPSAVGVAQVDLYIDGKLAGSAQTSTDNKYRFTINWAPYLNGEHALMARAVDKAGNKADSARVIVTVRN